MAFRVDSRRWWSILALAAVYFVSGRLGLNLKVAHGSATPVWAPTGISLAALLLFGRGVWPGVALGAFLVNVTTPVPTVFAAIAAVGNTLAVLLAHAMCRRGPGVGALERFDQVVQLVIAALASPVVSATIGAAGLWATGVLPATELDFTWLVWWLGDSLGFMIVTPLLLAWWRGERPFHRPAEAATLALLLVLAGLVVVAPWSMRMFHGHPPVYMMLPFVVWAAVRFEQPGATLAAFVTSAIALWGSVQGYGPLPRAAQAEVLLVWQVFSMVVAITALAIAGTATERARAERALREQAAMLERRVAERTSALRDQNDQMVEFTWTISHDLRAPIRAIRGYVDALADDVAPGADGAATGYLTRIRDAAGRMDALITDLLAYSRLGKVELAHEPLAVRALVDDAVAQLQPEFDAARVRLRVTVDAHLPRVTGHRSTLVQALTNVLRNASLFVAPGCAPEIAVHAEPRPGAVRVWVEDNGIGIDPEHHGRIFNVFERLHPEQMYQGTGIGLAMVKRAVERMGGTVGVESRLGAGSRFWIDLRTADEAPRATGG